MERTGSLTFGAARPFDRCYWVAEGKLLAGCYPGKVDKAEAILQISHIIGSGVTHFVNLMRSNERDHEGRPFTQYCDTAGQIAAGRNVKVSCVRYSIPDMGVPSAETMVQILDDIDAEADAGGVSYLHCWGGRGRTGTVVGCWLVRHGVSLGPAALQRIAELRQVVPPNYRGESPETREQRDMVRNWKRGA